ncbi:SDR family NAD(P)-dependent oxidoreductase [Edaphosphingomonas haloaromaticamans]|uniref:Cyclopentanol dehydrogenase n=1 Tax=Edaphosphingomonas haloaromaticamans TaxID=653954 RepID=A0A1S1H7Z8_9SPHN|nr:glucose 1-dehydrogenase [Sphingomonas haloaromaticamans]OHT18258.1 Cyclopentanol dehydrogenase [Sphingomonas haloaromaticamans]
MGNRLDGKVCIVTGGGSGMGRACAIEMATQGGRVVVADINEAAANETLEAILAAGGEGIVSVCNLRNPDDIRGLMHLAADRFGGIDVLHNNAAVHETDLTARTSIEELPEDIWDAVYEINLKAIWLAIKFAFPFLKHSQRGPAIVNVASTGAFVSYPQAGAYCATKGGVLMLTKAAAVDLAPHNIRCNCYCPGAIDTPMVKKYYEAAPDKDAIMSVLTGSHLIRRLGKPEEIAKLACFLASNDSSFITGAAYVIDGGTLAWRGTHS